MGLQMSYQIMANFYDELTNDVPYDEWVNFIEKVFKKYKSAPKIICDLGCGTGTVPILFSQKGYQMIGVDSSIDMLAIATKKSENLWNKPLFLQQKMEKLDLYGTCDAFISCLDSINYIADLSSLKAVFEKVHMFLSKGGLFIFDINTEYKLRCLDGSSFVRETENVFCVWQTAWSEKKRQAKFFIDFFVNNNEFYSRMSEMHVERGYSVPELCDILIETGFKLENIFGELSMKIPADNEERIFFVARKI